jgi:hypothetical protein
VTGEITTERQHDGTWAVVRRDGDDEQVLATHPQQAGAEAEAFRLAGEGSDDEVPDPEGADEELHGGQGALPEQSGG